MSSCELNMGGRGWSAVRSAVRSAVHRRDDIQKIIARTTPLQLILAKPAWRHSYWEEREAYRRNVVSAFPYLFPIARAVLVSYIAVMNPDILRAKNDEYEALWTRWEEIVSRLSSYNWDKPVFDLNKETLGGLTLVEFLEKVAKDTTEKYHLYSDGDGTEYTIPIAESLYAVTAGSPNVIG